MNGLALYNGISAFHLACDLEGIVMDNVYYAEICPFANKVTALHYPNDIPLGDVLNWRNWDIDWASIDVVSAGFPCQSWSMAGQQMGDQDPRGALFWTTLEIMQHVLKHNPDACYFLENVKMKTEFENYITYHTNNALGNGTIKTLINSSLLSAQSRERFYWTNFPIWTPQDKGIVVRDILEHDVTLRTGTYDNYVAKSNDAGGMVRVGTATDVNGHDLLKRIYAPDGKSPTLTAASGGNQEPKIACDGDELIYRKISPVECERLQTFPDNWTACLSNTQRRKTLGNAWTVDVIAHILRCMIFFK